MTKGPKDIPESSLENSTSQDRFSSTESLFRAMAETPDIEPPKQLAEGTLVGQYFRIKKLLGSGGMGAVYLAHDTRLGRDIALKLQFRQGSLDESGRLTREAKALARLTHPNVVTVHEVGEFEGHLFIAMEYVEGETLNSWLNQQPRDWRQVLEVMLAAGRGIAAAHSAGLVHRDFKPTNVLVGKDQRVRVADFGLARPTLEEGAPQESVLTSETRQRNLELRDLDSQEVTKTGFLMGTPAYMAPEQYHKRPIDARADQFSYCVTLYEALVGQRPFDASSLAEMQQNIADGQLAPLPKTAEVPSWLLRITRRGLHSDPDLRFATMDALLSELTLTPVKKRRRLFAVAATLLLLLVTAAGYHRWRSDQMLCRGGQKELAKVWTPQARQAIKGAFVSSQSPLHQISYTRVIEHLTNFTQQWLVVHQKACESTRIYKEQSEQALDLKMVCLESQLRRFQSMVEVLTQADKKLVDASVEALPLPNVSDCSDVSRVGHMTAMPKDPLVREKIHQTMAKVEAASLYYNWEAPQRGERLLTEAEEMASDLNYYPLNAELTYNLAVFLEKSNPKAAPDKHREAIHYGSISGYHQIVFHSTLQLASITADKTTPQQALRILRMAKAALDRFGGDEVSQARYYARAADIYRALGRPPDAVTAAKKALELREKLGNTYLIGKSMNTLGAAYIWDGEYPAALELYKKSLAILEPQLGEYHMSTILALQGLSLASKHLGDYQAAIHYVRRAIAAKSRLWGETDSALLTNYSNLAVYLQEVDKIDDATEIQELVNRITEEKYGKDHYQTGFSYGNTAIMLEVNNRSEDAYHYAKKSLEVLKKALGKEHTVIVNGLCILGTIQRSREELSDSEQLLRQAMALAEKKYEPHHPERLNPVVELAKTELAQGNINAAHDLASKAKKMADLPNAQVRMRPDAYFALATVLWEKQERAKALALASEARDLWRQLGYKRELEQANKWLAQRVDG